MLFDLDFAIRNFAESLKGIPVTLLVTGVAFLIGFPIAFFIALVRLNKVPFFSQVATVFLSYMRGTPVIVQIFLVYNVLPVILQNAAQVAGIEFDIYSINPLLYAFFVYALNASASYSEMWKAGLSSVAHGQYEAANTIGLTKVQSYIHIIIPQAVATAAPSFCSGTLSMLKNTSLVFLMTVQDITARAKMAAGLEYKYLEGYVDIFITYIIVCVIIERLFKRFEKKIGAYKLA